MRSYAYICIIAYLQCSLIVVCVCVCVCLVANVMLPHTSTGIHVFVRFTVRVDLLLFMVDGY